MGNIKYPELIDPCKSAISEGRCTGCQALELPFFKGNKNCKLYDKKTMFSEQNKKYK